MWNRIKRGVEYTDNLSGYQAIIHIVVVILFMSSMGSFLFVTQETSSIELLFLLTTLLPLPITLYYFGGLHD